MATTGTSIATIGNRQNVLGVSAGVSFGHLDTKLIGRRASITLADQHTNPLGMSYGVSFGALHLYGVSSGVSIATIGQNKSDAHRTTLPSNSASGSSTSLGTMTNLVAAAATITDIHVANTIYETTASLNTLTCHHYHNTNGFHTMQCNSGNDDIAEFSDNYCLKHRSRVTTRMFLNGSTEGFHGSWPTTGGLSVTGNVSINKVSGNAILTPDTMVTNNGSTGGNGNAGCISIIPTHPG